MIESIEEARAKLHFTARSMRELRGNPDTPVPSSVIWGLEDLTQVLEYLVNRVETIEVDRRVEYAAPPDSLHTDSRRVRHVKMSGLGAAITLRADHWASEVWEDEDNLLVIPVDRAREMAHHILRALELPAEVPDQSLTSS